MSGNSDPKTPSNAAPSAAKAYGDRADARRKEFERQKRRRTRNYRSGSNGNNSNGNDSNGSASNGSVNNAANRVAAEAEERAINMARMKEFYPRLSNSNNSSKNNNNENNNNENNNNENNSINQNRLKTEIDTFTGQGPANERSQIGRIPRFAHNLSYAEDLIKRAEKVVTPDNSFKAKLTYLKEVRDKLLTLTPEKDRLRPLKNVFAEFASGNNTRPATPIFDGGKRTTRRKNRPTRRRNFKTRIYN